MQNLILKKLPAYIKASTDISKNNDYNDCIRIQKHK